MGSAYDHLSREQLLALLTEQSVPSPAQNEAEPSSEDRYRQMVEAAVDGIFTLRQSEQRFRALDVQ